MPNDRQPVRLDPLAGGGEMGQLMRSVNWAGTSVGPVDGWPQSLRTALSIVLENHFAMYIAWGKSYTQFYNDAYRPILGSTKHPQALGRSASETFAESFHIIGPMFDGVMQGNAVGSDNWMLPLDRHGFLEECYFNFSYSPIRDESGEVGGILVTVAETTARVLGERRLQILQALASRTQEATTIDEVCRIVLEVLGESTPEIPFALLYLLDDGQTFAHLAGSAGVTLSPSLDRIDFDAASSPFPLASVVASGQGSLIDVLPLGEHVRPVEGSAANRAFVLPIARSGDAAPYGILIAATSPRLSFDEKYRGFIELVASQIATTIGSVRALMEARARAEALVALDREKTAFFSNVSHEFRTPLTLLLGPTEDALADPSVVRPADAQRWQFVHRNALRLLKLVNTLLDFSRIEAGRIEASYAPADLNEFTRQLVSVFRSAIERAGIKLSLHLDALDEPVYVDHDMWEKVVFNLLSNALKFTFEGEIAISLRRDGHFAVLRVRDSGVGIPADELPFLFDRFHRVQGGRGRTQEGTGIGLALVRELVRLHGGTVEAESAVDRGTTFTVTIPFGSQHLPPEHLAAAQPAKAAALRAASFVSDAERWLPEIDADVRTASPEIQFHPARILLADDNADMRDYVTRLLEERWTVDAARDGASALAMIEENPPDLVLADIMMPGLSGFDLLARIRADARIRAIPVIFLSARAGEEARVEGLQAGADDYLAKPFSARELIARVATHLELSRLRLEAERARERMHQQFMQAPVAVCVLRGSDLLFELANPRYEEMVGRKNVAGKTLRQAFPELNEESPVIRMLEMVYESGRPFQDEAFLVKLDRTGSGVVTDVYFKFTAEPLRNREETTDGIMIVAVDVTEQVTARQQLELQAADLDRLNRAKDEFLATLSHELRTPLTSILGWARLLKMQGEDDELRRTGLESIDHSAQLQAQLIDDVLDLSRVTTGKVRVEQDVVDLAEVASAVLDGVRLAASAKTIQLRSVLPEQGETVLVLGDRNRLQQILWNLLTNAMKFTPAGGIVTLTLRRTAALVEVTVTDSGIGIPHDFLQHVFEPFRQADSSTTRTTGGLGLGLSIVRHLTEIHGGRVTAASEGAGKGAAFMVQLPLLKQTAATSVAEAEHETPLIESSDALPIQLQAVSVLIIDDQESVRDFFAAALRRCGAEVREVQSVQQGIAEVEKRLPDIVISDIAMPGEDGFAFLSWMRARPSMSGIPVLAITAFGRPEDEERTIAAGFSGYVRKPVDPSELASAVAAAISRRPA